MSARLLLCAGVCLLLGSGPPWDGPGLGVAADEDPIPDKVGAEVHLSKGERNMLKKVQCGLCKAIIREMHIEVEKHAMTKKGWGSESQVWETSNAMCLAMLQKYKLNMVTAKLETKAEDEDEQMAMGGGGGDPALVMRGMLVLKMGCQQWLEDHGSETSGYIYKHVKDKLTTPEEAASHFCTSQMNQCGKGKKEKQRQEREQEKQRAKKRLELRKAEEAKEAKIKEENPLEKLPEDSKFGLSRMLEMAKDDPLHYMEEPAKERIVKAQKELRCDVCFAAVEQVHSELVKRPKSMQREYDILPFADGACEGGKDLSVPAYFGIDPPPLPPLWTDRYRPKLDKKSNKYILKPISKKAGKKRQKWRALTVGGKHKPPGQDEYEGDMMMTMSCKDAVEPAKIVEELAKQLKRCSKAGAKGDCNPGVATAQAVCKAEDESPCSFTAEIAGSEKGGEPSSAADKPKESTEEKSKKPKEEL
mmetsp:Transcript_18484/g.34365  ORF Transcript_18484/g.34365 Transcript_18484/m.34365 type:complete len:474 (-) Transcript_18484:83-1504(-)